MKGIRAYYSINMVNLVNKVEKRYKIIQGQEK